MVHVPCKYSHGLENIPITGWAINPEIGPANHTRLVNCSDRPSDKRNGVPYLTQMIGLPRVKDISHDSP